MPFISDMNPTPNVNYLPRRSHVHSYPAMRRHASNDFIGLSVNMNDNFIGHQAPRSRVSYPWLRNDAALGYGDYSGYMAPRPPVYASIVSLGGDSGRPASYYCPQVAVSIDPEALRSHEQLRNWLSRTGDNLYVRNFNSWQGHLSRPRSRRTVCVGPSFSLPPVLEEDGSYGRVRTSASSVVMGTQAISLSSQKVNNIEKAERMKALSKMIREKENEEAEEIQNRENSQKTETPEDSDNQPKDEVESSSPSPLPPPLEDEATVSNSKKVSFAPTCEPEVEVPGHLTRPRVRLSYVEPVNDTENAHEVAQLLKKKRRSWAAGDKLLRLPERSLSDEDVPLNNERLAQNPRSRSLSQESATLFPRTESCVNAPKCKKRLSWASCERKRFSWSPRSLSAERLPERRRYSIACDETRRTTIRMGTRSLMSISGPLPGSLVHLSGHGPMNNSTLADIVGQGRYW